MPTAEGNVDELGGDNAEGGKLDECEGGENVDEPTTGDGRLVVFMFDRENEPKSGLGGVGGGVSSTPLPISNRSWGGASKCNGAGGILCAGGGAM